MEETLLEDNITRSVLRMPDLLFINYRSLFIEFVAKKDRAIGRSLFNFLQLLYDRDVTFYRDKINSLRLKIARHLLS